MQPIGPDYLAVERAVLECAWAGCETIWLVCNDDMQPLIRTRLGEYVIDPVSIGRLNKYPSESRRKIPIYYVPIHPKDLGKRDCLAFSALYGALTSYHVSNKISKWVVPSRYYVAFPYGVYDPEILREHRLDISSDNSFFLSSDGKTVANGEYLGFTFDEEEYKKYKKVIMDEGTGYRPKGTTFGDEAVLPLEERWSAVHFKLDTVFRSARIAEAKVVELPQYNNIGSWQGLRDYLASDMELEKPNKLILSSRQWNKIGEDIEKE